MRIILATLSLLVALACGGGSSSASSAGGGSSTPPPPPPAPQPVPAATFRPKTTPLTALAPVGSAQPVFIVAKDGTFRYESANFEHAQGAIWVDLKGDLQLTGTCTLTQPDGTTGAFTLTGTLLNGHMVATTNAGNIDMDATTLQADQINLADKSGDYVSTASSLGYYITLHLMADGTFTGYCFSDPADIGLPSKAPATFSGHMDPRPGNINLFDCGLFMLYSGELTRPSSWGFAYFDGSTLYMLTANQNDPRGGQFSATFALQQHY